MQGMDPVKCSFYENDLLFLYSPQLFFDVFMLNVALLLVQRTAWTDIYSEFTSQQTRYVSTVTLCSVSSQTLTLMSASNTSSLVQVRIRLHGRDCLFEVILFLLQTDCKTLYLRSTLFVLQTVYLKCILFILQTDWNTNVQFVRRKCLRRIWGSTSMMSITKYGTMCVCIVVSAGAGSVCVS